MGKTGGMQLLGHDLSTVLQCEKSGVKYFDFSSSQPQPPEHIVAAHGANLVRIRVWVNPPKGYSDFSSLLEMSRRAKQAGLNTLLCLHLSDYWADPGQQATPSAWATQPFLTLCKTVESYITNLLDSLQRQGTPPFMVAVGNEISNGMLWPTGSLQFPSQFTALLKSGLGAVQRRGILTMVHINNGQDASLVTWFMDLMVAGGVSFDYLGLSFYPGDGALLSDLKSSLAAAAGRYNKPMVIAETADSWTPSPERQEESLRRLLEVVRDVPRGLGAGVCYWEGGWVAPGEAYPGEGNEYWTRALWDQRGRALPALRCYEPYAKASHENKHEESMRSCGVDQQPMMGHKHEESMRPCGVDQQPMMGHKNEESMRPCSVDQQPMMGHKHEESMRPCGVDQQPMMGHKHEESMRPCGVDQQPMMGHKHEESMRPCGVDQQPMMGHKHEESMRPCGVDQQPMMGHKHEDL